MVKYLRTGVEPVVRTIRTVLRDGSTMEFITPIKFQEPISLTHVRVLKNKSVDQVSLLYFGKVFSVSL